MLTRNTLALAIFLAFHAFAAALIRQPRAIARQTVHRFCCLLLGGNLLRYGLVYPAVYHELRIPAEFSTVAYFVVPVILLAGWEQLRGWAAYSGLMAGFFYYAAMVLAGETLYGTDTMANTCISMLCHGTLYFCGLVTMRTERYPLKARALLLGTVYVALRAAILRPWVIGRERMLIYTLVER